MRPSSISNTTFYKGKKIITSQEQVWLFIPEPGYALDQLICTC